MCARTSIAIDVASLRRGDLLGRSITATVRLAMDPTTAHFYAVKTVPVAPGTGPIVVRRTTMACGTRARLVLIVSAVAWCLGSAGTRVA